MKYIITTWGIKILDVIRWGMAQKRLRTTGIHYLRKGTGRVRERERGRERSGRERAGREIIETNYGERLWRELRERESRERMYGREQE